MKYITEYFQQYGVRLEASIFQPHSSHRNASSVDEFHILLHVEPKGEMFQQQLNRLYALEDEIPLLPAFEGAAYVMKRYFLSDSTNQYPLMRKEENVALSFIQQQPLDGSKVAVWLYMQRGAEITAQDGMVVSSHNGYQHLWKMGMQHDQGDSAYQTEMVLQEYENLLERFDATLERNCVRTWFFVRDVDTQYAGMVTSRKANFTAQGLTEDTHYIASTGIQGLPANPRSIIQLGTYAIAGAWNPEQQRYLYAPTHLNPTYEYGVTFERGVRLEFGDRAQSIISGTASIDNKGAVVHVGNIELQTQRMWENVEVLLQEADMTFDDVAHLIVYLRDTADYERVNRMFKERFPQIPTVIVLAPVCRPTWLIEMECIAVKQENHPQYPAF